AAPIPLESFSAAKLLKRSPCTVILRPLLLVAKHCVSLIKFFKLFLRGFVAGIQVWMVLSGELSERLFDVILRGSFINTQYFIVVFYRCRHLLSLLDHIIIL